MVKLLLTPVAIAVVMNALHTPPPMSVKVTSLPVPQRGTGEVPPKSHPAYDTHMPDEPDDATGRS